MAAPRGIPFPASRELFVFCRGRLLSQQTPDEPLSDADIGRLIEFENTRTSRWKHGRIEVADATRLLALAQALDLPLALVAEIAAGRLTASEAAALLEEPDRYLEYLAALLRPLAEGQRLSIVDDQERSVSVEKLGLHKFSRQAGGPAPPRASGAKRKVALLGDDDPDAERLFLNVARDQPGLVVVVATSGPEALLAAGRTHPDLVLLDVFLPGIDGFSALRTLARAASLVIATAANLTPEVATRARGSGAADVVRRPLRARVLSRILRQIL